MRHENVKILSSCAPAGAPMLSGKKSSSIAPDSLVIGEGQTRWCEVKAKSEQTYYHLNKEWQTGIEQRHWNHYQQVEVESGIPVWLVFVHLKQVVNRDIPGFVELENKVASALLSELRRSFRIADDPGTLRSYGGQSMVFFDCKMFGVMESLDDLEEGIESIDVRPVPRGRLSPRELARKRPKRPRGKKGDPWDYD